MNASKGAAMKPLVLALSAGCLALALAACGGNDAARSAGPVPSVPVEAEPAAAPAAELSAATAVPEVDYVIDLDTGVTTALPENIIQSLGRPTIGDYAASSDGSRLAYVAKGDDGRDQIFVAAIDGTGVHQATHDPKGARSPAWSPDGTKIAYLSGCGHWCPHKLAVLDVASGESTQIDVTDAWSVQFTPDGSSLLYTYDGDVPGLLQTPELRTVPVAGGESTLFIGPDGGLSDAAGGSISPDGARVTYFASGTPRAPDGTLLTTAQGEPVTHCGACWFGANVDGTAKRVLPCWGGTAPWSPDSTRVVCTGYGGTPADDGFVAVVDVATGRGSSVAEGEEAIWLDDHTLLVEVSSDPSYGGN
jgi:dipeptidyl aminopeptidase/acylaminoacyl peptidase